MELCFLGHAMAQAVRCQPLTAEGWVRVWTSPFEICGGQSVTVRGFSWSTPVLLSVLPPLLHTNHSLNPAVVRRTRCHSLGILIQASAVLVKVENKYCHLSVHPPAISHHHRHHHHHHHHHHRLLTFCPLPLLFDFMM